MLVLLALVLALLTVAANPAAARSDSSLRASGTVSAVQAGSLTIVADTGQTMTFRLVATTGYEKDGQPASESALAVGQHVKVKYRQEPDGSLKAKEVKIEPSAGSPSAPVQVRGSVISVSAQTLVVKAKGTGKELTIRLASTTIYEKNGGPATEADLRVGQRVKVKYRVEPDGSLKAQKVKIEPRSAAVSFQLEGIDAGGSATTLLVRVSGLRENGAVVRAAVGRTITVRLAPGAAVILNNRRVRLGALVRGDRLHLSGTASNGVFTAQRVVAQRAAKRK